MRRASSLILLDDIDRRLLTALELNARQPNLQLAQAITMSESACANRIKRLEQAGVIRRYISHLDLSQVCQWLTFVLTLTITAEARAAQATLEAAIKATPAIITAKRSVGGVDYVLTIVGPDAAVCPTTLNAIDPKGRFVAHSNAHLVVDLIKPFAGSPQLQTNS